MAGLASMTRRMDMSSPRLRTSPVGIIRISSDAI
jgi:hypothetical protein